MAKSGSRATIIDIAKRANVSFKTVSRVLNDHPTVGSEIRARVTEAMAELDYRPNTAARMLAGPRGYAIALLISSDSMSSYQERYPPLFFIDMQFAALLACQHAHYRFFVEVVDLGSTTLIDDLRHKLAMSGVDGVLIVPPIADDRLLLDALGELDIPVVRVLPGIEPDRSASVGIDDHAGALMMTRHLLSLGHRHIAFIAGPENHLAARERRTGFCKALADAGIASAPMVVPGDFTFAGGMQGAEDLLSRAVPPSAIFAANDDMAIGVLAVANRRGIRVPEQLSVVGFDDSTTARLAWPALTTVRQPITALMGVAVERLIAAAGGEPLSPGKIELPSVIIERESAGPPPHASKSDHAQQD